MTRKDLSRRSFLKSASAATAGAFAIPYIISSKALGSNGRVSPSNKITMACIGVGGMGTSNMRNFLGKSDVRVVAVCDVDKGHRQRAKNLVDSRYGNNDCVEYHDFRQVLQRDDIDTVMLGLPDHWHGIVAVAAAKAGKDIYGEKPLAYNISEGRAIVDAVERYGRIWQTGSWQRSQSHFRRACELVRNGVIGKVHTVNVGLPTGNGKVADSLKKTAPVPEGFDYDFWLGPAPQVPYCPARCHFHFRWVSDYSGGQLTDWAGHHIDIAHWGMNTELSAPVEIIGKADFPKDDLLFDTPGSYRFECTYKEGFKIIVADRQQQPRGMGTHFIGTDGWIHVSRSGLWASSNEILNTQIPAGGVSLYKSTDHWQNFLDCVKTRTRTVAPAEIAHHSVMVAHLGTISMRLGKKLNWDLSKERFINDSQADRFLSRPMRGHWHV